LGIGQDESTQRQEIYRKTEEEIHQEIKNETEVKVE
jgi:hypothetical protein